MGGFGGSALQRSLKILTENRTPVRLEIENSELKFYTVVALREEQLLVAKPVDLNDSGLKPGAVLRFVMPDGSWNVVRMRLVNPKVERRRGDSVMLFEVPQESGPKSQRRSNRYNTSRYNNLVLTVPHFEELMRIIDISMEGCKVYITDFDRWELVQVGMTMRAAKLLLGSKVEVPLPRIIPRMVKPPTASFEWHILPGGKAAKFLGHAIPIKKSYS